ncbi:Arginase/agmatinase/formimionoglutamate hydrolase, arginase family (plasmid) [Cupriavidus necator H850]|uniref:agmatinase n=1 Tax=Cupriavidus necator TaxID=106590 RepID=UPI00129EFD53|nr:agmatinase [Cupriavidus necator]KAI3601219.1 Arginase/agmatinase/formimionoglutamate hydrolase, arginase family [Cupriavidus necator H850]
MSFPLTVPPSKRHQSFLWSPLCTDLDKLDAHVAILGIPYGQAYSAAHISNDQSKAPDAVRAMSDRICRNLNHYDFDVGGPIYDNRALKVVDCGNVPADPQDLSSHSQRAEQAIRKILDAGALPITLGGDHGIPIPILRAYEGRGLITLIHIDAHLDWRDHVNGVRDGLSSPIRRASEMDHVGEIFQIGLRAQGSGRPEEYEAAVAYGAHLYTAYDVHENGMKSVLDDIPDGGNYYLTIDADGIDPSVMPAVAGPALGGITYVQMRQLIHGLVKKGRVVGMDIVEITPSSDVNNISCIAAGRLMVNLIGAAVRADYFDAPKL